MYYHYTYVQCTAGTYVSGVLGRLIGSNQHQQPHRHLYLDTLYMPLLSFAVVVVVVVVVVVYLFV